MATSEKSARIGMVNFINTAPLYEVWKETVSQPGWQVVEDTPAALNRMLHEKQVDLGFVSSHEFAVHHQEYLLLPGPTISATGAVRSVLLFSEKPLASLTGELVQLSGQSQTSNSLIKIILEEFYQVRPRYALPGAKETPAAVLAIGDEALRQDREQRYPVRLDLGEVWSEQTGLPFVFAVWAVRREFYRQAPEVVGAIHRELLRCVATGRQELPAICEAVAPRIPMAVADCYRYLRGIEFDLEAEKQAGLTRFFNYLIARGEATATVLPLAIV